MGVFLQKPALEYGFIGFEGGVFSLSELLYALFLDIEPYNRVEFCKLYCKGETNVAKSYHGYFVLLYFSVLCHVRNVSIVRLFSLCFQVRRQTRARCRPEPGADRRYACPRCSTVRGHLR